MCFIFPLAIVSLHTLFPLPGMISNLLLSFRSLKVNSLTSHTNHMPLTHHTHSTLFITVFLLCDIYTFAIYDEAVASCALTIFANGDHHNKGRDYICHLCFPNILPHILEFVLNNYVLNTSMLGSFLRVESLIILIWKTLRESSL